MRDHMGTPRELLTESGKVVWAQKLSVWGRSERYPFSHPQTASDDNARGPDCPWRFAGQWADEESGLYYNRFRYYDSETAQYLSPDPMGLAGGLNPYGYVQNPLSYIDPLGLCNELSQVQINRANGKAWEATVTQTAKGKYGANNVLEQVYIRPLDANGNPVGYRVIVDDVITSPNSPIKLVDAKASTTAPFTKNQKLGYPLLSQNGGIIESGPLAGTTIGPTSVSRIDPTTIGNL
ncbi:RHS repeat-associated core domain-containing protein [Citrobacter sp. S2-9]|uniref:RHS repeat-associated core domain-containing protein n=1 Tax=Citrobacter enshiensis TaxID=2971264 RepID=A0ABT8Q0Z5_9ENTR|nr:RHS repeat-associated core domain-containing protein [Citrobacter enshiensis]MDN8602296.1 RHS repeat-associated core domain-containing protein [Citrobacter enshiensis]